MNASSNSDFPVEALLTKARGFLAAGWVARTLARDAAGHDVDPTDATAVCWCAWGALYRATGAATFGAAWGATKSERDFLEAVAHRAFKSTVHCISDEGGQAAALALYDEAIRRAAAGWGC